MKGAHESIENNIHTLPEGNGDESVSLDTNSEEDSESRISSSSFSSSSHKSSSSSQYSFSSFDSQEYDDDQSDTDDSDDDANIHVGEQSSSPTSSLSSSSSLPERTKYRDVLHSKRKYNTDNSHLHSSERGGMRMRNRQTNTSTSKQTQREALSPQLSSDYRYHHKKKRHQSVSTHLNSSSTILSIQELYKEAFRRICSKKLTTFLVFSAVIWLYTIHAKIMYENKSYAKLGLSENSIKQLRERRQNSALTALGSATGQLFTKKKKKKKGNGSKDHTVDKLPSGCSPKSWHMDSYPTCNIIHEIDLRSSLGIRKKRGKIIPADLGEGDKSEVVYTSREKQKARAMGYLGSGLWRQVWGIDPNNELPSNISYPAVLKAMKQEHNTDVRNADRHRRDALVMEKLTSSEYIMSIYGFCGNTVLTEYGGHPLDDYILGSKDIPDVKKYSRNIEEGKIRLALDVMRSLQVLHEVQDGPIIHADIQAKQFLIDPIKGVKLNDFNRCRFVPTNDKTGSDCKITIQSAPGANRSPEEYEQLKLDEKIDIFSTANILYSILTGSRPWGEGLKRLEISKAVMKKERPRIDARFRRKGTLDAVLAELIDNMYEYDPVRRYSAKKGVEILENALETGSTSNTGTSDIQVKQSHPQRIRG